jgi:hypothetical protein
MSSSVSSHDQTPRNHTPAALVPFAWTLLGIPLVYGLYQTIKTAIKLFTG